MNLHDTLMKFLGFAMIFPLIPFCFFPVSQWIKSDRRTVIVKIFAATCLFCCIFVPFLLIKPVADLNSLVVPVGLFFFWFYNREINLEPYKKMFWFCTACLLGGFSFVFSIMIESNLHPYHNLLANCPLVPALQIGFLILADIVLYLPSKKYYSWVMENLDDTSVWKVLWLFPLLFLALFLFICPREYEYVNIGRFRNIYCVIISVFFLLVLLFYTLFYRMSWFMVQSRKMVQINQFLSMQAQQYEQILSHVQETSRLRHDFRHQITVITELLHQKEYTKMEEYLEDYVSTAAPSIVRYCYSAPVNAVLSHYNALCQQKGIDSRFRIVLPEKSVVPDMDLCVLFGNLLENALYGCDGVPDAYISLKTAQTAPHMVAIRISNPYTETPKKKEGRFRSSRHAGYGIGLESVQMLAEKYHGTCLISTEDHVFTVKVLLQV